MLLLIAALLATFVLFCVIYYFVPKGHVPWHAVWPGALFVTVTTAIANAVYPFYLAQVSSVGELGGTIGFVLIALVWFYLVSLSMMAGAVINALRYELRDKGFLALPASEYRPSHGRRAGASRSGRRSPRAASAGRGAPGRCGRFPSASASPATRSSRGRRRRSGPPEAGPRR